MLRFVASNYVEHIPMCFKTFGEIIFLKISILKFFKQTSFKKGCKLPAVNREGLGSVQNTPTGCGNTLPTMQQPF